MSKTTSFPNEKELQEVRSRLDNSMASRPLPANASAVEKVKYKLCEKFVIYKNKSGLTQTALAKKIGIDKSLMSKILHYHFDEFTTDRLLKYLSKIYPEINFDVSVA